MRSCEPINHSVASQVTRWPPGSASRSNPLRASA